MPSERLSDWMSDEKLAAMRKAIVDPEAIGSVGPKAMCQLIDELKERRAADLTPEDLRCLAWAREEISVPPYASASGTRKGALEAIDKLLGRQAR